MAVTTIKGLKVMFVLIANAHIILGAGELTVAKLPSRVIMVTAILPRWNPSTASLSSCCRSQTPVLATPLGKGRLRD